MGSWQGYSCVFVYVRCDLTQFLSCPCMDNIPPVAHHLFSFQPMPSPATASFAETSPLLRVSDPVAYKARVRDRIAHEKLAASRCRS